MSVDQDHLVRLLLGHRAMLLGYLASFVRDAHLVEDVFQDVSLVILKKGAELADPAGFAPWARKIARFESLNALRKRGQAPRPLDAAALDLLDGQWRSGDASESPASDALEPCLRRLAPRARRLVELRYREGVSGRDLAARLAQPLNTVYVSLARVHRALSECIRGRLAAGRTSHA
jgi:RNA polymerase sigma-70 factor (ECF subfamily)